MRLMHVGRRGGKTYEAVKVLAKNREAVLVVASVAERARIIKFFGFGDRQDVTDRILVAETAAEKLRGRPVGYLAVDNIEWVLGVLLGHMPDLITLNRE